MDPNVRRNVLTVVAAVVLGIILRVSFWDGKPAAAILPANTVADVNQHLVSFWQGSQTIFDDQNGIATWYIDANSNTGLIAAMLNAVPLSYGVNVFDWRLIPQMEARMAERKKHLEKAEVAFREYANTRQALRRRLISSKVLWNWYGDKTADVGFLRQLARMDVENTPNDIHEPWADSEVFARNAGVEIIAALHGAWTENDVGKEIGKHLATMLEHLKQALDHEVAFIDRLKLKSMKRPSWESRQAGLVLPQLHGRVVTLADAQKKAMKGLDGMARIVANPPRTGHGFATNEGSTIGWSRIIDGLLTKWGTFLLSSQDGALFAARREMLKGVKDLQVYDFDASWKKWKSRNCGGTSCFEATGGFSRVTKAIGLGGSRLAGRARDEDAFCKKQTLAAGKKPRVWRRIYEQVCCMDGSPISEFIKYAPADTVAAPAA
ncbi:hypothetical protein F4805DRAFT_225969 [Annulohypoxylon moriforme]|nr:hypothetical protein F4805DRAFT_225969 [Annulohypoxylon moriforme]